jgi:hypothetical protein
MSLANRRILSDLEATMRTADLFGIFIGGGVSLFVASVFAVRYARLHPGWSAARFVIGLGILIVGGLIVLAAVSRRLGLAIPIATLLGGAWLTWSYSRRLANVEWRGTLAGRRRLILGLRFLTVVQVIGALLFAGAGLSGAL